MKRWGIFLSALLVFGVLNYAIYHKEKILKSGEIILLELVPIDPRSLIQGDYMRLGFAIENAARNDPALQSNGYLVIELDKNKKATFSALYHQQPLKNNERLVRYVFNKNALNRPLNIQPNSFLFQEGQGRYFQPAKFAIFHYNGNSDYVLVGLADEKGNKIEPPKTTWLENKPTR